MPGRHLTHTQHCNLVTLWLFGMKSSAIARHFGIATSSVTRTIERMGYRTSDREWSRRVRYRGSTDAQ